MAQAMIHTSNFCCHATTPLKKKHPSLYSPLPPRITLTTFALFKPKTKPKRRVGFAVSIPIAQFQFPLKPLEAESRDSILTAPNLIATVLAFSLMFSSAAYGQEGGGALFNRACIGCHVGGGNIIQPGATLFADDLERNGVATEEEIYGITYSGKGRMPGFGEKCTPRGQCTFGPRLMDEEIRLLAQFVKLQAQQGWPKVD